MRPQYAQGVIAHKIKNSFHPVEDERSNSFRGTTSLHRQMRCTHPTRRAIFFADAGCAVTGVPVPFYSGMVPFLRQSARATFSALWLRGLPACGTPFSDQRSNAYSSRGRVLSYVALIIHIFRDLGRGILNPSTGQQSHITGAVTTHPQYNS